MSAFAVAFSICAYLSEVASLDSTSLCAQDEVALLQLQSSVKKRSAERPPNPSTSSFKRQPGMATQAWRHEAKSQTFKRDIQDRLSTRQTVAQHMHWPYAPASPADGIAELHEAGQLSSAQVGGSSAQLSERMLSHDVPILPIEEDGRVRYCYQQQALRGIPKDFSCKLYGFNTMLMNMGGDEHPMHHTQPLTKALYKVALAMFRQTGLGTRTLAMYAQRITGYEFHVLDGVAKYCLGVAEEQGTEFDVKDWTVQDLIQYGNAHCRGELSQCGFVMRTFKPCLGCLSMSWHMVGGWFEQRNDHEPEAWLADSMAGTPRMIGGVNKPVELSAYGWGGAKIEVTQVSFYYKPLGQPMMAPCSQEVNPEEGRFCRLLRGQDEGFGLGVWPGFPAGSVCNELRPR